MVQNIVTNISSRSEAVASKVEAYKKILAELRSRLVEGSAIRTEIGVHALDIIVNRVWNAVGNISENTLRIYTSHE
jgi:hypothetical protein